MTKSLEERFWSKVDKDGPTMNHMDSNCWVWTGSKTCGYGQIGVVEEKGPKVRRAHRLSLFFVLGRMPTRALHRCDNKACVRPDHLYEGTQSQNILDAFKRKLILPLKGAANPGAKIGEDLVREIRRRADAGESITSISRSVSLGRRQVGRIAKRQHWSHID